MLAGDVDPVPAASGDAPRASAPMIDVNYSFREIRSHSLNTGLLVSATERRS